jgi:acyl-CoA reductase-like NAD-dependent aldehyde dehydrogenase
VNGIKEYRYFAGGEWRTAENHKLFDVFRPYDRGLYAGVAAGGRPEAKLAVGAAAKAFPAWSQTTPAERARLFFKAAEIVKRRRAEIADILANETGSTISFGTFQQDLVAATIEQAAGSMYLPKGEVLETNVPGTYSIGVRRPLGVVASFTPWNVNDEIHAPMGGVRDSGWGRTGPDSLKEFQDVIWINSHSGQRQYPI